MANEKKVGVRIEQYRAQLKMSQADLAEQSGVSVKVIEALEKGEVLPALGVLTKLARALGQRLGTFMDDQFQRDPVVMRAADLDAAKVMRGGVNDAGYAYYSLAGGKCDRHMEPFVVEFAPGAPVTPSSHEGEEFIACTEGEVELIYGGETTILKVGDTAYYNSVVKHALKAHGTSLAKILAVVFMPN